MVSSSYGAFKLGYKLGWKLTPTAGMIFAGVAMFVTVSLVSCFNKYIERRGILDYFLN